MGEYLLPTGSANIFAAFLILSPKSIPKLSIIGQDPIMDWTGQWTFVFSVNEGVATPAFPGLNFFKGDRYGIWGNLRTQSGNLERWANQRSFIAQCNPDVREHEAG